MLSNLIGGPGRRRRVPVICAVGTIRVGTIQVATMQVAPFLNLPPAPM